MAAAARGGGGGARAAAAAPARRRQRAGRSWALPAIALLGGPSAASAASEAGLPRSGLRWEPLAADGCPGAGTAPGAAGAEAVSLLQALQGPSAAPAEARGARRARAARPAGHLAAEPQAGPKALAGAAQAAPPAGSLWQAASGTVAAAAPVAAMAKTHFSGQGTSMNELLQALLPLCAIALGGAFASAGQRSTGIIVAYFGAQSGFSLYMKMLLSSTTVSEELGLHGIPAPFLVTAVQQLVVFGLCAGLTAAAARHSSPPSARRFNGRCVLAVVCCSAAFAGNIGLNNYSLSLIAVSLNLVIRSCLPLVTLVMQLLVARAFPGTAEASDLEVGERDVLLMAVGVVCAGLATVANGEAGGESTPAFLSGAVACLLSVFLAGVNLVFARMLGTSFGISPMDATLYTALPSSAFLLLPALAVPHPTAWPEDRDITDLYVFLRIWQLRPEALWLVALSGVLAAGYCVLQFVLVLELTPTHAAFAGNFNKAATIALSIWLGLDQLPGGVWSLVMVAAVLGNVVAFTGYSIIKAEDKTDRQGDGQREADPALKPQADEGERVVAFF